MVGGIWHLIYDIALLGSLCCFGTAPNAFWSLKGFTKLNASLFRRAVTARDKRHCQQKTVDTGPALQAQVLQKIGVTQAAACRLEQVSVAGEI